MGFFTSGLSRIVPELVLTGTALALFLWDAARPGGRRTALGLAAAGLAAAALAAGRSPEGTAYGVLVVDPVGRMLKMILLGAVGLVLALSARFSAYRDDGADPFGWGTYAGLLLLSSVGLLLLVSATDFLAALIALELVSVSSFVLAGFSRRDRRSAEAAMKYFLTGAFASGLMIYGLSLLYGVTGTTAVAALAADRASALPALPLTAALFFILAGFGFKLALAPFHMWVPDVYEGAPTPVAAYLSVGPKAAAFALMIRLLSNHSALQITGLLAALSALTMTVGNLGALRQSNVKRLLGYSSIAQMGYVLMGFTAAGGAGFRSVFIYLAAYAVMNLGAFAAVIAVTEDAGSEGLDAFDGLARRSLPLSLATTVFLLSLTGIPPLVGFVGKFALFGAALQAKGLVWLAVVGVVNSVVSFAYYFSIVRAMFFAPARRSEAPRVAGPVWAALGFTLALTVGSGLWPGPLLALAQRVFP